MSGIESDTLTHVLALHGDPWAVEPMRMRSYLSTLVPVGHNEDLEAKVAPRKIELYSLEGECLGADRDTIESKQPFIAVMPLVGPITLKASFFSAFFGGTSIQKWVGAFRSLMSDPSIAGVLIDVDSPGGSVAGITEAASVIRKGASKKPVVAVANTWIASAAYHLASQANEIYVSPSGEVGSVGVFAIHMDYSKQLEEKGVSPTIVHAGDYKVEKNPFEPLTEEAKEELQSKVNHYYDGFVKDVAKGRGVDTKTVVAEFGQGRMLLPKKAISVGAADGIATFEEALVGLGKSISNARAVAEQRVGLGRELERLESEVAASGSES
jgi:signal peptide peptidase SppA